MRPIGYAEKWINCSCGNRLGGTYIVRYGYIFTCKECGKTHRGGLWIRTLLWGMLPISYLSWRARKRMHRFLVKECKRTIFK